MTIAQIAYLGMIFIVVSGGAFALMRALAPHATRNRLNRVAGAGKGAQEKAGSRWEHTVIDLAGPLAKLSLPSEGWDKSVLRTRFMHAGYRGRSVPVIYFASKTLFAFALPGIFFIYASIGGLQLGTEMMLMILLGLTILGYYLPNVVLARVIATRQRELFESFPDAIDLMTVCIEAGLGLDAAMARVGEEMRLRSEVLTAELHLVGLELRAGLPREQALRNLSLRTGIEEIEAFVSMLVQADRFGTSIATSLRVHSDTLRTTRRLRAEESAEKIAVKLLFPLIFFIFPSLLVVLMGPAFINIYRVLLPALAGQ
jgi:tight adherence protein C